MQQQLKELAARLAESAGIAYKDARGLMPSVREDCDITEEVITLIQAVASDCADLADHLDTTASGRTGKAIRERFGVKQ